MSWTPHASSQAILERAWGYVNSVTYIVSLRWLFYRLYQDGTYTDKHDYAKCKALLSRARKEFYGEWKPWTLADETRRITYLGGGYQDEQEFLAKIRDTECELDNLSGQSAIVAVLFEAKAMSGQFEHYVEHAAMLCPFGGDPSIPFKWKIARTLAGYWGTYQVPVHVIYFGDYDAKGAKIEISAKAEILSWAKLIEPEGDLHWTRGGLDEAQVQSYGLPLSIEGQGYQWEALSDEQAEEIIEAAVGPLIDLERIAAIGTRVG